MPGHIYFEGIVLPTSCVGTDQLKSGNLDADKLQHLHTIKTDFGHAVGDTPTTEERTVHVAGTAGIIRGFHCLLVDSGTNTDIDFDLKVNGSSVLSAAVNYVHGDGDGTIKDGTVSSASFSAGDRISIASTVTVATGAQGPFAWAVIEENAAT